MEPAGVVPVDRPSTSTVRTLLTLSLPAIVVGVVSALMLFAVEWVVHELENGVWELLPHALGIDASSGWWIFGVLTATGLVVGLVVWLVPGHGGRDSATVELIAPPLPLSTLPSLALVAVVGFAGGASLGPEAPVIAINTALLVALIRKLWPAIPVESVVMVTAAGTIGALFGTPVAAALVFTGLVGARSGHNAHGGDALWDRLFLPLLAAASGALTTSALATPSFSVDLPAYVEVAPADLLSASVVAAIGALLGLAAAVAMPRVHRLFRLLRNPALYITLGGVVLGLLGAVGGEITLFKGLSQMGRLVAERDAFDAVAVVLIVVVKVLALVVSAAAGFSGGRIFPAVFVGVALGVLANDLLPGIPLVVGVAGGVLGMVLAVSRDGWISLFIAVAVTGSITVLPVLCIAVLPAWLIVSRGPEMIVHSTETHEPAANAAATENSAHRAAAENSAHRAATENPAHRAATENPEHPAATDGNRQ
ncbi:H+/Cl- antiporter ClcA [Conyzicola lurida]|uniref:H+/Cl- antiporter ClcA n=1 Tax=Conyzicola lurida TaxID=1172621 RepID=A0A841AMD8_9MICO|nr:ion channel protein [Conyzicola lurida]MBB5842876.1 H+/Cl- antiporter ClcA [Conyzicola lurida]